MLPPSSRGRILSGRGFAFTRRRDAIRILTERSLAGVRRSRNLP
jgi:hypothetical protein